MKVLSALFRYVAPLALTLFLLTMAPAGVKAVEIVQTSGTTYNTSRPTQAPPPGPGVNPTGIPDWDTGWSGGVTGWDYVAANNPNGAVYLGNGWVITAAHVGPGYTVIDGTTYTAITSSFHSIVTASGTADLILYQIYSPPSLPTLNIASSTSVGSLVAIIGYGPNDPDTENWGLNTIDETEVPIEVDTATNTYMSMDFETDHGSSSASLTNYAALVAGDSGGGDFVYADNQWQLAGINEANGGTNNLDSYMIELSDYRTQIDDIIAVPEPGSFALAGLALTVLLGFRRKRGA